MIGAIARLDMPANYHYVAHSTERKTAIPAKTTNKRVDPIRRAFAWVLVPLFLVMCGWSLIGLQQIGQSVDTASQAFNGHAEAGDKIYVAIPPTNTAQAVEDAPRQPTPWPTFTPTPAPSRTPAPTATQPPTITPSHTPTLTNTPTSTLTPTTLAQYLADEYDKLALSRAKRNNLLTWIGVIFGAVVVLVICSGVLLSLAKHWIKSLRAAWHEQTSGETTQEQVKTAAHARATNMAMEDEAWELLTAAVKYLGADGANHTAKLPGHRDLDEWGFDRWQRVTDWLVGLGLCYKQSGGANPGTYFKTGNLWVWLHVAEIGRLEERGIQHNLPTPPEN